MALGFPLHIDLSGNNCTIFGGDELAAKRAAVLLRFGAKVTVISPTICPALQQLSDNSSVRHIPRRYFRGDCSNAQLCVAATDDADLNIRIATECKAKNVPVNVTSPATYGTFHFPRVIIQDGVLITVSGDAPSETKRQVCDKLKDILPTLIHDIHE